ncbi:MAG: hypothetical protein KIT84_27340 [Labilithrix sp.]|nr:hypothetical protein [Labilithrix sp.]MCW5814772.1 hypothetical protein [Labilithrix sp.]
MNELPAEEPPAVPPSPARPEVKLVDPAPATPAELARRSAERYDDNEAGLVGASRLGRWLAGWPASKPAGVEGDLVVLQLDPALGELPYVAEAPGVRVYHAAEITRLLEPRNDGVTAIGTAPANGVRIDSFMRRFDIHPNHDFVLFVAGEGSATSLATLARAWLSFRYWGLDHERLGVLNGPVAKVVPAGQRRATVAAHPFTGTRRIVTEERDHFALLADVGAVRAAIGRDLIVDARPADEHAGAAFGASALDETCLDGAPLCTPVFSGRIAGARSLPSASLLEDEGAFKPRDAIASLVAAAGVTPARTAYVYDLEGYGSALVAFAFLAVVGQPARWYAASYLEWGALNASHPEPALRALAAESPWRTDRFPELTEGASAWADVARGVRPLVFDGAAARSTLVQESDAKYKQNPPPLPAVGAGQDGC